MTDFKQHIRSAVQMFGSQAKLADAMGCSQQQISYLLSATSISAEMAAKVHTATNGSVSKHVLRPDIFGDPPVVGGLAAPVEAAE